MSILNQVVGIGGFAIVDNLRLVVIAIIFVGIIAVLLRIKFARSGDEVDEQYHSEEEVSEGVEGVQGASEGVGERSVADFEAIGEKAEDLEQEISVKSGVIIEGVRAEFTSKMVQLDSKIEEGEEEVVGKVENVTDSEIQEALSKRQGRQ